MTTVRAGAPARGVAVAPLPAVAPALPAVAGDAHGPRRTSSAPLAVARACGA
ncbi:hypothetical protein ACIP3B_12440 [Streptomyces anulatus]|uniref:hypothetical protein n=1 Tax=Streptomyces anulatus TaxID=1892 RepID=UPI0033C97203